MASVPKQTPFQKLCYGSGDLGCTVIWNVIAMFLTIYLTDSVAISGAAVAGILLSVRIFDGFSDLVMGYILDRTTFKLGKARPWILFSSPFMAIFLVLCFSVPNFASEAARIVFAFTTYFFLTVIVYTACNLSYCALQSFVTDDSDDRASMNSYRFIMTSTGSIILGYVTPVAARELGWFGCTLVYGIVAFCLLLLCFFVCKENIKPQPRPHNQKVSVKEMASVLVRNKYFYFLLAFFIIDYIILGVTGGGGMYLARYIVHNDAAFGNIHMATNVPQIIGCLLLPVIARHIGKWRAITIGYGLFIIGFAVSGFASSTDMVENSAIYWLMLAGFGIKGFGLGMHFVSIFAMVADVVEYGEWKTGRRLEGATYSVTSFGFKAGIGIGGAIVGAVLAAVNYDASLPVQPEATLEGILAVNIWIPLVFGAIGLVVSLFDNIDRIYPTVVSDLKVRRAKENQEFAAAKA